MYSRHNEGKSEIAERFIKTSKPKIYKKMISNDSNSYVPYLNKLVENKIILFIILLIKNLLMLIILLWR